MLAPNTILQHRYQIIRQLGQGGMGTVYEAKALRLNSTVALKETHFTDEQLRKQFEREAQLLANLRHPALPRVIDHFDEGEGLFLVMDFIKGEDLWELLQSNSGGFPPARVLEWADQLLAALDYLHRQEPPIIHRDIKPQNLKVSDSGQIILLDFGLAKGFAGQFSRVTTSGSIFGYTPNYAPLEQIQGMGTDPRSDLYSLAATLYHLMTGSAPPDVLTRLTATTEGQPDPLRSASELNSRISSEVADLLNKGMSIPRNQRFNSAAEMRQALHRAQRPEKEPQGESIKALPPTIVDSSSVNLPQPSNAVALQPTVADSPSAQHAKDSEKEAASTGAARASAAATAPAQQAAPSIANSQSSLLFEQAKPRSGRLPWLIVGLGLLLIFSLIFVINQQSGGESNLNSTQPNSSDAPLAVELTGVVKQFVEATNAGDEATVSRILADEFMWYRPTESLNKRQFLKSASNPASNVTSDTISDFELVNYAANSATVNYYQSTIYKDGYRVQSKFTATLEKREGRWQITSLNYRK